MIVDADNEQFGADTEAIDLQQYWRVVVKRRRLIAMAVASAVLLAVLVSLLTTPTYKATVLLNVEREKASAFDIGTAGQSYGYDPEFLPTQTRLMQSREIAERVVRLLNLTDSAPQSNGFLSSLLGKSPKEAKPPAATDVARGIQAGIETRPIRGTNLVELSFVATSPEFASNVANALADSYIDWNLEAKFAVVGQASRFLGTQIEQLKAEIDDKERALQAYGAQTDIVSVDPQTNITMQRLESINRDYSASVADRVAKEARYFELQNARPESIADTLSTGLVSQLRTDLAKLERDYAEKLNLFKPEWPAMQQLKAQIDKGRQNLSEVISETVSKARDNARTEYMAARRREESLAAVLQGGKREAMALNTNAVEYNNLRTEVETKRALLDNLLKRQAETEVASRLRGERISNIRVVDRALPPVSRFRPSYKRNGLLALFFGFATGLGLAFLLEYLDRSIRSTDQVEELLGLPALGVIPSVGGAARTGYGYGSQAKKVAGPRVEPAVELIPHTQPHSTVSEAYRRFRAALLLSRAGGIKSITVTSSQAGEGKTSTATNTGIVLSQLGKNVLIIDGDLHNPRMHEVFRVSNRQGLVTVLAEGTDPSTIIKPTPVPNLFVLTAGPLSPNPSGLLSSEAMVRMVEWATTSFDYVIFDTPPVGPIADAMILGRLSDGVVIAVKGAVTPRDLVGYARDHLVRAGVRVLGVLINNLPEAESVYGRYYGYYGRGAMYGEPPSMPEKTANG